MAIVAAGNEGNDLIHIEGSVGAGLTETITITVPSFSNTSGASNDYFSLELWWNNNADVSATVNSPNSKTYTRTADQTGTKQTTDGTIQLYNITDSDHSNGDRRTFFQVYDSTDGVGPAAGDWDLEVTNNTDTTMTYHAWLYASSLESNTKKATVNGGDTTYTVSSPGSASSAITVGSFAARWRYTDSNNNPRIVDTPDLSDDLAYFSSIGPNRGGEQKPDICASGLGLISTTSTDYSLSTDIVIIAGKYHFALGSSMSSGSVAGAAALLLDYKGSLTAAQVKSKLTANADQDDTYTGVTVPNAEWGYGKLNVFEALSKTIGSTATVDHDIYVYDTWSSNATVPLASGLKTSVRFSPTSGDVTGAFFHPGSETGTSNSISFEIWSDSSGTPVANLGSTVTMAVSDIGKGTWNFVALKATGVSVSSRTDYHLVCKNTASANFKLNVDNGSSDSRSHYNTGSSWTAYGNDWRMRAVVSTEEATLDSSLPVELVFFNATTEKGNLVLKWATESEFENQGFSLSRRAGHTADWKLLADHTTHSELEGQGSSTSR
ncbi:MAG: S8 family serine peptidase, partial [Candidatus Marinimicrobia bacterium]|nr:S8 family serine peptidase [Candidatus Neomarinimicrobiota bacterium]